MALLNLFVGYRRLIRQPAQITLSQTEYKLAQDRSEDIVNLIYTVALMGSGHGNGELNKLDVVQRNVTDMMLKIGCVWYAKQENVSEPVMHLFALRNLWQELYTQDEIEAHQREIIELYNSGVETNSDLIVTAGGVIIEFCNTKANSERQKQLFGGLTELFSIWVKDARETLKV